MFVLMFVYHIPYSIGYTSYMSTIVQKKSTLSQKRCYTYIHMTWIQTTLQTIWASLVAFGLIKSIIVIIIIALVSRAQKLLGLVAAILFIAFLAHWI